MPTKLKPIEQLYHFEPSVDQDTANIVIVEKINELIIAFLSITFGK